jgi:hypothetical protein
VRPRDGSSRGRFVQGTFRPGKHRTGTDHAGTDRQGTIKLYTGKDVIRFEDMLNSS